ncbi:MAG: hypothetical protein ABI352_06990 [Candidatus Dormibacter sp.]
MKENSPGIEVTRPVLPVLVRPPETGEHAELITDPTTARVADLCNVAYEVLLQVLYRLMCHVDERDDQVRTLAAVGVSMMFDVIKPLADVLTTLPVGPEHPGRTAGATFELFYQPDYLLPHRRAAWLMMAEHLSDAAVLANHESATDARFQPVAEASRAHADPLQARRTDCHRPGRGDIVGPDALGPRLPSPHDGRPTMEPGVLSGVRRDRGVAHRRAVQFPSGSAHR